MLIIVAGIGTIGTEITKKLVTHKHDVVAIDIDNKVCENIYNETGAVVINGSATDINVLKEAGAEKADILLCMMRSDSDNIAASLLGKGYCIPRIIACLRKPSYEQAYLAAGVNSVISLPDVLLNKVVMEVEQPPVNEIMNVGKGKASVYAVIIPEKAKVINKKVKEIARNKRFPDDCILMGVLRKDSDEFFIPRGNFTIQANDTVFLIATITLMKKATDYLTKV